MTITEFLLARVAEDETVAREAAVAGGSWRYAESNQAWEIQTEDGTNITHDREGLSDSVQEFAGPHVARHDPARVLAECEAKRRIIARLHEIAADNDSAIYNDVDTALVDTLKLMALPYADHPDYRDKWRP